MKNTNNNPNNNNHSEALNENHQKMIKNKIDEFYNTKVPDFEEPDIDDYPEIFGETTYDSTEEESKYTTAVAFFRDEATEDATMWREKCIDSVTKEVANECSDVPLDQIKEEVSTQAVDKFADTSESGYGNPTLPGFSSWWTETLSEGGKAANIVEDMENAGEKDSALGSSEYLKKDFHSDNNSYEDSDSFNEDESSSHNSLNEKNNSSEGKRREENEGKVGEENESSVKSSSSNSKRKFEDDDDNSGQPSSSRIKQDSSDVTSDTEMPSYGWDDGE